MEVRTDKRISAIKQSDPCELYKIEVSGKQNVPTDEQYVEAEILGDIWYAVISRGSRVYGEPNVTKLAPNLSSRL